MCQGRRKESKSKLLSHSAALQSRSASHAHSSMAVIIQQRPPQPSAERGRGEAQGAYRSPRSSPFACPASAGPFSAPSSPSSSNKETPAPQGIVVIAGPTPPLSPFSLSLACGAAAAIALPLSRWNGHNAPCRLRLARCPATSICIGTGPSFFPPFSLLSPAL